MQAYCKPPPNPAPISGNVGEAPSKAQGVQLQKEIENTFNFL